MNKNAEMKSFLDVYQSEIAPKLMEIDIAVKTLEKPLGKSAVCRILQISKNELNKIMERNAIKNINRRAFFIIMQNGTSDICKFYRREVECGSPYTYRREKIAYIYNLKIADVNYACDKLGIVEATPFTLPILFSEILIPAK